MLIDVREEEEYRGELGHIAGARLIPLKELPERTAELANAKGSDIVAICRVGVRSATAAAILTGLGFEHVWNLKGWHARMERRAPPGRAMRLIARYT